MTLLLLLYVVVSCVALEFSLLAFEVIVVAVVVVVVVGSMKMNLSTKYNATPYSKANGIPASVRSTL